MSTSMQVRWLAATEAARSVAAIDRTEDVEVEYEVVDGAVVERPLTFPRVAPWDPEGTGPHSVAAEVAFVEGHLAAGATLLGAFVGDRGALAGLAVVQPRLEGDLAQLAFLHVSREHRRRGAATALWDAAVGIARGAGASALYVSATPTGSAVGFYRRQGCELARPPHPTLFAAEPDDIHLVCRL